MKELAQPSQRCSNPGMDAVIFDMDGVIVDSEPIYDLVTAQHLLELGVEAEPLFFDTLRGLDLIAVWQLIKAQYALQQPIEELAEESRLRLDNHFESLPNLKATEGTLELLQHLKAESVPLALASSSRTSRVEIILRRLEITDTFSATLGGDQVTQGKPSPEIFLEAAARLCVRPSRCVVIEDSIAGLAAARAADMIHVGVITAAGPPPEKLEADLLVSSLSELTPQRLRSLVEVTGNRS
ncbi:MAG: HAD family phosphatase [bacterium]|nr:HAD family phosphatase [bacterium]